MIAIEGLFKRYQGERRRALDGIGLSLPTRGLVFVVGESGAGKTTLVSIIGGMDNEFEGKVTSFGKELRKLNGKELSDYRLGYVAFSFQNGFLDPDSSAKEEIHKGKELIRGGLSFLKAERLLKYLGIKNLKHRKIKTLSGGERKRVSLAKALVKDAPLTIVDEPTANLDPDMAHKVLSLLREKGKGSLILVITHDRDSLRPDDQVIEMRDGKIVSRRLETEESKEKAKGLSRKKVGLWRSLKQALRLIAHGLASFGPATFAMSLALVSAGMSLMLLRGAKEGISSFAGRTLDPYSIVAEPLANSHAGLGAKLASSRLAAEALEMEGAGVLGYGSGIFNDVNDVFTSDSGVRIALDGWEYPFNLGLSLIARAGLRGTYEDFLFYPEENGQDGFSTVALGLPLGLAEDFARRFSVSGIEGLGDLAEQGKIRLMVTAAINDLGRKETTIAVNQVFMADTICLAHDSPFFAENFFGKELNMEFSDDLNALDPVPNTLKAGGLIYVERTKVDSFFRAFVLNPAFGSLVPVKAIQDENSVASAFFLHTKRYEDISPLDCLAIVANPDVAVSSYALSSPIYTFVYGGIYEGFATPLFVAKDKESLNEVADLNGFTELDLRGYSLSSQTLPDGVLSTSLVDSIKGQGIFFSSEQEVTLAQGRYPLDDGEIAISAGLAKKMFGSGQSALGRSISLLFLESVEPKDNGYVNGFAEGTVTIVGVSAENGEGLYHDSFFPLAFAFANSSIAPLSLVFDGFVIKLLAGSDVPKAIDYLSSAYPSYEFSAPMYEMAKSIDETLSTLAMFLGMFAGVAIVLAACLLALTVLLCIKRDEQRIGDFLALGYRPSQVRSIYCLYSLLIGLFAALQSFAGLRLASQEAGKALGQAFMGYRLEEGLHPYLLSLAIALSVSFSIGFLIAAKASVVSPKKALAAR